MWWKELLQRKKDTAVLQAGRYRQEKLLGNMPVYPADSRLYEEIRSTIPIIDAALDKIVRLLGGFEISCASQSVKAELEEFCRTVPVGTSGKGINQFLERYLDDLLLYGNAAGEMTVQKGGIRALYNVPLENLAVKGAENGKARILVRGAWGDFVPAQYPDLILFTALRPKSGEVLGQSVLAGLPFVSEILMKIYKAIGNNFQRLGNLRYAVTYHPQQGERVQAQETAQAIAQQWGAAMQENGAEISDFVAVGDVRIQVIGADCTMLDTDIPVRQMLEQVIAKMGIPPFMLGLHWSSTERMSRQQADILTSEMEYYRSLLTPVVQRILELHLRIKGIYQPFYLEWQNISLQDEGEAAQARFANARAAKLEQEVYRCSR